MTGHRPRDARGDLADGCRSSAADPTPPPPGGAHRPGRHTKVALGAAAAVPVAVLTERPRRPWPGTYPRHRLPAGQQRSTLPGAVLGGAAVRIRRSTGSAGTTEGFGGIEVYAEASLARRSARDTVARLAAARDRVYVASRTASGDPAEAAALPTGATAVAGATAYRLRAIQHADRLLVEALDDLDVAKAAVGAAERELGRFHPHGGTLVVTYPVRRIARDRLDRAVVTATTRYHLADNATYALVKEIVAGERAVRAVDQLVYYLLDHGPSGRAATAPPPFLRLVRAALPRTQRLDWWRELCSLFAECRPDERRAQTTSQLLNAPRTIWTGWATAHHAAPAPKTDDEPR